MISGFMNTIIEDRAIYTGAQTAYNQVIENIQLLLFNKIYFYILIVILIISIIFNIYFFIVVRKDNNDTNKN
jgi:hypothetical protein